MADGEKSPAPKSRTSYCPRCHTRYAYDATECVTCATALVDAQPRDTSIFRPKIDLPFLLFAVLFLAFYGRLPGEARSFGTIFLVVGAVTLVTFRYIRHAEWIGRR
jgi:hypothetical protein